MSQVEAAPTGAADDLVLMLNLTHETLAVSSGVAAEAFTPEGAGLHVNAPIEPLAADAPDDFSEAAYLVAYPDIAAAIERGEFRSALHHYEVYGLAENRLQSARYLRALAGIVQLPDEVARELFWPELYFLLNPDVRASGMDAFDHYSADGRAENRQPHPLLDAAVIKPQLLDLDGRSPHCILAGFLQGPPALAFHTLVDVAYMQGQDPTLATAQDCFRAVADPDRKLTVRPHPLFDPEFYRAMTAGRRFENELIDYILVNPVAGRTHPLFDPLYYLATSNAAGNPAEPTLARYIRLWREWLGEVSPLVDLKFLNHQISSAGHKQDVRGTTDPLSYALTNRLDMKGGVIHPHADSRVIQGTFITLLRDLHDAPEALQAAEVIKSFMAPRPATSRPGASSNLGPTFCSTRACTAA